MSNHTSNAEERMKKSIESLEYNFGRVRTGRANPHILDAIKVDYYGVPTPITQLAGVKVPEASMLVIEPWDKSSLNNIEKAIRQSDLGITQPEHYGCLTAWAQQGVLLLNTVLTVREGNPNSHKGKGWEQLTDRIISELNKKDTPVIFLLWGNNAIGKAGLIDNPIHRKLTSVHPSPLSAHRGFLGCRHFSRANDLLAEAGLRPIDWQLCSTK
jgi:hypothetical protein